MPQPEPTSLSVIPSSFDLFVGTSQQLTVHVLDQFGQPYTGPTPIVYTSQTPSIATVSSTGLVTGVSPGAGNISVTCGAAAGGTFPNIRI
jgi:uncharacterized protein YjdB